MTDETCTNDTITLSRDELETIKDQLKAQILRELSNDKNFEREQEKLRRAEEKAEHDRYVAKMKESPDPWVDIIGWVQTDQGIKVELDWNEPFVDYLRQNGVSGADDDQVVQKWLVMLMRDLTEATNPVEQGGSSFE